MPVNLCSSDLRRSCVLQDIELVDAQRNFILTLLQSPMMNDSEFIQKLQEIENFVLSLNKNIALNPISPVDRIMIKLSNIIDFTTSKLTALNLCDKSENDLKQNFLDSGITFCIKNDDGYDFTSEFSYIYGQGFHRDSLYRDTSSILRRVIALSSCNNINEYKLLDFLVNRKVEIENILNSFTTTTLKMLSRTPLNLTKLLIEYRKNATSIRIRMKICRKLSTSHTKTNANIYIMVVDESEISFVTSNIQSISSEIYLTIKIYPNTRCVTELHSNIVTSEQNLNKSPLRPIDINSELYQLYPNFTPIILPRQLRFDSIKYLACSSNHILVLSSKGIVFSLGNNSDGALGHGDFVSRNTLTRIDSLKNISKIAAGGMTIGSHSLAISDSGEIYGWGNAYGVGIGKLTNYLSPEKLQLKEKFLDVSCGNGFSVALSETGNVFSWGNLSRGRLGLGSFDFSKQKYRLRPTRITSISETISSISCGEGHVICVSNNGLVFAWGRNIEGQVGCGLTPSGLLKDVLIPECINLSKKIVKASAGAFHSSCLDVSGNIWTWGGKGGSQIGRHIENLDPYWRNIVASSYKNHQSSIMIPFELIDWCNSWSLPARVELECRDDYFIDISGGHECSMFLTYNGTIFMCGNSVDKQLNRVPRRTSVSWMNNIYLKKCIRIFCCWSYALVIVQGELISTITSSILEKLESGIRNHPDCILVSSNDILQCHSCIIASRSVELYNMINVELLLNDNKRAMEDKCQLLLPEFSFSTIKNLRYFLYTDMLPNDCYFNQRELHLLCRCCDLLHLPRLLLLCKFYIDLLDENSVRILELPPYTLGKDFSGIIGDKQFSDVKFIVENNTLYGHKVILQSRSKYFASMFYGNLSEGSTSTMETLEVILPDTYVAFLRLITFCYTNSLASATVDVYIDDLILADKYGVSDMFTLCESLLFPDSSNCVSILEVAIATRSWNLIWKCCDVMIENNELLQDAKVLGLLTDNLVLEYPALKTVLSRIEPSNNIYIRESSTTRVNNLDRLKLLMMTILSLIFGLGLYQNMSSVVSFGIYIPIINTLLLVIFAVIFARRSLFNQ